MEIVLEDRGIIPGWVKNRVTFRRWARSKEYPSNGQFGWLGNKLWMDLSPERDSHNQIKSEFCATALMWAMNHQLGRCWGNGMLLSHLKSGLSTEPDGMFASWETLRSGRLRLINHSPDADELTGTPDMVLEVVSPRSVRKDYDDLPALYWAARIPEYWRIDNRASNLRFDLLRHTAKGYRAARNQDGWRKSAVFGAAFRLTQTTDPLGEPAYTLAVR